ncbi:unnamed protein product [Schistosoma margrebowiei]|uniref:Uncharacterized protein n=1 Tax=Schistosoma margrebowiei TaxID=48269 RepID=A0A183MH49_9TREM|nr:unnamed protein product [Schistosoma margrebowiei]
MAQCVPPTNSAQECESRTPEISTQQFTTTKLSVDEILNKYVGEYGVWQWSIVLLIVLSSPLMVTLPVFVNAVPEHRCRMEDPIEEIFKEYNLSFEEAAAFVEFQYPSTVVAEFNLVCDKSMLSPLGTSLFMVGMLFGFIFGGYFGDKFGRRNGAIVFSIMELLAAVGVSLAPNHHIYHLMRTIVGFSSTGKAVPLRLLPIELTNAKYRSYFTSFIVLGIVFGHPITILRRGVSERFINLFKSTKKIICSLIICVLIFTMHSLAFLGITLFSKYINYNIYIVTLINALTVYRCYKYRRFPLMCTYIISAILLCIGGVYTVLWEPLTDNVLNIFCNGALIMYSASTIMLSIYCAELFPSYMRSSAVGISNGLGRIGGIISTLVNYTDFTFKHGTPVLIYSGSSMLQAFLLYCLRDTSGEDLSDVDKCLESATDDHIHQNGSNKSIDAGREEFVINLKTLEDRIKSSPTTVTNL